MALRAGSIIVEISGSLGARAELPTELSAILTTLGSSIHPQTNGHGWEEAARQPVTQDHRAAAASPGFTARWLLLLLKTSPEVVGELRTGPTAAAVYGSLRALATMPTEMLATSTTFGSSILRRMNGPG